MSVKPLLVRLCCELPPGLLLHISTSTQSSRRSVASAVQSSVHHRAPTFPASILHSSTLTASVVFFFPSSAFFHTHSCTVLYSFPSSAFFHTHSQCGILLPQFCILPHSQPVSYCSSPVLHSSTLTASVVLFFPSSAFFQFPQVLCSLTKCCVLSSGLCQ